MFTVRGELSIARDKWILFYFLIHTLFWYNSAATVSSISCCVLLDSFLFWWCIFSFLFFFSVSKILVFQSLKTSLFWLSMGSLTCESSAFQPFSCRNICIESDNVHVVSEVVCNTGIWLFRLSGKPIICNTC